MCGYVADFYNISTETVSTETQTGMFELYQVIEACVRN